MNDKVRGRGYVAAASPGEKWVRAALTGSGPVDPPGHNYHRPQQGDLRHSMLFSSPEDDKSISDEALNSPSFCYGIESPGRSFARKREQKKGPPRG
jgi:hypothetical protein